MYDDDNKVKEMDEPVDNNELGQKEREFKHRPKEIRLYEQKLNLACIASEILAFRCKKCSLNCKTNQDSSLSIDSVLDTRKRFWGASAELMHASAHRRNALFNMLETSKLKAKDSSEVLFRFFLRHEQVCEGAYLLATGISQSMVSRMKRAISEEGAGVYSDGTLQEEIRWMGIFERWEH